MNTIRFIDLFCGIGGFRYGAEAALCGRGLVGECVFSSDIDEDAQRAYRANFGEYPTGDITQVDAVDIPDHELLLAGFPCQPFSIIGSSKGFDDTRGTLFFDIARILEAKRPQAFVLENVKQLVGHDRGRTISRIREALSELCYHHEIQVLNALNFGLPQKRERVFIVGYRNPRPFPWPQGVGHHAPLSAILERDVPEEFFASDYIKERRFAKLQRTDEPTIWHENKAGHISAYPYSCALRAGASYNYLLVNGERRLTPREMLRLQGFPEGFDIVGTYSQIRKQCGNAVPVPLVRAVVERLVDVVGWRGQPSDYLDQSRQQYQLALERRSLDWDGDHHEPNFSITSPMSHG